MAEGIRKFSPVRMTASSEAAAVEQALLLVGASREEVEVEVVEQSAKGITVRVKPRSDEAPMAAPEPVQPEPVQAAPVVAEQPAAEAEVPAARHKIEAPIQESPEVAEAADAETAEAPVEAEQPARSQQTPLQELDAPTLERARYTAQQMLDRMGMEARVRVEDSSDMGRTHLQIEGEDVGILIGKHGQTLQSFQYLLNLTLNNKAGGEEGLRIVIDAGGYRTRRAASLEQTALSAAARAKRDRRSVRLEPMPAYERRLIHMALAEEAGITTSSEGREPQRHVVVTPAGARPAEEGRESRYAGRGQGGFGGFGGRGGANSGEGSGGGYGNRRGGSRNYGR